MISEEIKEQLQEHLRVEVWSNFVNKIRVTLLWDDEVVSEDTHNGLHSIY